MERLLLRLCLQRCARSIVKFVQQDLPGNPPQEEMLAAITAKVLPVAAAACTEARMLQQLFEPHFHGGFNRPTPRVPNSMLKFVEHVNKQCETSIKAKTCLSGAIACNLEDS